MIPTAADPVATLVFFLLVFTAIGAFFLFIHLVAGSFIRPYKPDAEKLTIYECGEPTVGSAWVQFDLRYYVVALLFVIFDVEVAFFFPWATVFGTVNQLASLPPIPTEKIADLDNKTKREHEIPFEKMTDKQKETERIRVRLSSLLMPSGMSEDSKEKLGLVKIDYRKAESGKMLETGRHVVPIKPETAHSWAIVAFGDILVFFGVLLVGFAYVWRRGDVDWVRTYAHRDEPPFEPENTLEQPAHAPPPAPVVAHH